MNYYDIDDYNLWIEWTDGRFRSELKGKLIEFMTRDGEVIQTSRPEAFIWYLRKDWYHNRYKSPDDIVAYRFL